MIDIYVDFCRITSTTSPDDALALLVAMYTIFELTFDRKSRSTRLIYAVLYGDKTYLPNSLRMYIREKNIEISIEKLQSSATNRSSLINTGIASITDSQQQTNADINSFDDQTPEHSSQTNTQTTNSRITTDNSERPPVSPVENDE